MKNDARMSVKSRVGEESKGFGSSTPADGIADAAAAYAYFRAGRDRLSLMGSAHDG